jgi:hypothetical protein
MVTASITLADTITIDHATGAYVIETAKLPNLAYLVEYALGVIIQRAPAGKGDDAAASRKAIETRIENLYSGEVTRAKKDETKAVAEEMFKKALKAKIAAGGFAKPEGDALKALFESFREKNKEKILAEVARRKAEETALDL